MDKSINRRIVTLEQLAAQAMAERERYAPYSEVRIRSIVMDRANVVYHQQGNYGVVEKTGLMTISEAFNYADRKGASVFVRMSFSPEWFHCFYQTSDLYDSEQKAKLREADCEKWPEEIGRLYTLDHPDKIITAIAGISQTFKLNRQKHNDRPMPSNAKPEDLERWRRRSPFNR